MGNCWGTAPAPAPAPARTSEGDSMRSSKRRPSRGILARAAPRFGCDDPAKFRSRWCARSLALPATAAVVATLIGAAQAKVLYFNVNAGSTTARLFDQAGNVRATMNLDA